MKLGLVINPRKTDVFSAVNKLVDWLRERDCTIYFELNSPLSDSGDNQLSIPDMALECNIIVVVGGDGTLLHVANQLEGEETPILGLNAGRLGFLTETTLDKSRETFHDILAGEYRVQERMMLQGEVKNFSAAPMQALNDLVLSRARHGRVIQVSAAVNDEYVTDFVCDGLIVSTPTGSTAYNLSANGPIVHPEMENIILNPICPHTLTNRPLIIPADSRVSLTVEEDEECVLTADGQEKITNLHRGAGVEIAKAQSSVSLIIPRDLSFYEILRTKLQWSGETPDTE